MVTDRPAAPRSSHSHCGTTRDADTKDLLGPMSLSRPRFHSPRRQCCLRGSTDDIQRSCSARSADCGSTTAAFSLPPPAIELTRDLWQG